MEQARKNKELIMEYINYMSNLKIFTREALEKYNSDPGFIDHIMFFQEVFPNYEVFPDEILAEGDRVIMRARFRGVHKGEWLGVPATNKVVEYPFVVGYQILNNKIIHSWMIADNLVLVEQLKGKSI